MTPRGATAAATAVVLAGGGRVLGIVELTALAVSLVAVLFVLLLRTWVVRRPAVVGVRRVRPSAVHAGGSFEVELELAGGGTRRTPELTLVDRVEDGRRRVVLGVAPLRPGERRTAVYRLPAAQRGRSWIGPLRATWGDALGFTRRRWVLVPPEAVLVLPEVRRGLHLPDFAADNGRPGSRRSVQSAAMPEFRSLRPYVAGDDPRRVHWPSTARTGELVVREDDDPLPEPLVLALDTAVPAGNGFELAVSVTATVLLAAVRRDRPVALLSTGGLRRTVTANPASVAAALAQLAEIVVDGVGADGVGADGAGAAGSPGLPDLPARSQEIVVVTAAGRGRVAGWSAALPAGLPRLVLWAGGDEDGVPGVEVVGSLDNLSAQWAPRVPIRAAGRR